MADVSVNVNKSSILWVLINQAGTYDIEFHNSNPTHNKTVTFDSPSGPPDGIDAQFTVEKSDGARMFTISSSASNGSYAYSVANGGQGNGGIEIRR